MTETVARASKGPPDLRFRLERTTGFEPATPTLAMKRRPSTVVHSSSSLQIKRARAARDQQRMMANRGERSHIGSGTARPPNVAIVSDPRPSPNGRGGREGPSLVLETPNHPPFPGSPSRPSWKAGDDGRGNAHSEADARARRAACRARRIGPGVRIRPGARRTTSIATWTSVRQAACTATGHTPSRVRSHAPTASPSRRRGALDQAALSGGGPPATRVRSVTPTVGRSRTAPMCRASPARLGWCRPVAFTSATAGRPGSARRAASSSGPSRRASRPG
jgi:hypothetical protein